MRIALTSRVSICGLTAATIAIASTASPAAITGISSATLSPTQSVGDSDSDDRTEASTVINAFTAGGTDYVVTGSVTDVSAADSVRFWADDATDPGSDEATLESNLVVTDGLLNVSDGDTTGVDVTADFGRNLSADETLFITDLGGTNAGDPIELQPIDSSGDQVGDYSLDLEASDFGDNLLNFDGIRENGEDLDDFNINGVAFTLNDFDGTTGTLSETTGIQIFTDSDSTLDPSVIGTAAIPEPASLALLGLGGLLILPGRRNRA